MKTVTITLPAELDQAAAREAKRRGISKSALIREGLDAVIAETTPDTDHAGAVDGPWVRLAGFASEDLTTEEEIDDIVYGS